MTRASRSRRELLKGLPSALVGGAIGTASAASGPVESAASAATLQGRTVHVADLTHRLTTAFNFNPSQPRIAMDPIVGSGYAAGMNLNRISLIEHTGTHLDAPRHFDKTGASVGDLPLADLVVPLAIVDISERVKKDRNAALEPADIERWESRHGALPSGCCVAIYGGWDAFAQMSADIPPEMRRQSPGFSVEVARMLIERRSVKGIALEAGSIDTGANSPAYPVHQIWLKSGRWAIEFITNLQAVVPSGALLIVGVPPIADATGFPVRALALF